MCNLCVCYAHKQVVPYSCRTKGRVSTATQELPSFTLASVPARSLPGDLFLLAPLNN